MSLKKIYLNFNIFSKTATWVWSSDIFIHSFIHQRLYSPLFGPGLHFTSVIFFTQTVGLLGWVISPSQGRYLHTEQHKHRINAHTDIHALSGIRNHDPRVQASEDTFMSPTEFFTFSEFIFLFLTFFTFPRQAGLVSDITSEYFRFSFHSLALQYLSVKNFLFQSHRNQGHATG
jgi:hypothetical protein